MAEIWSHPFSHEENGDALHGPAFPFNLGEPPVKYLLSGNGEQIECQYG
jgi:hypothetical protein